MGHTNSTANLSLPQFISTDKPTWLGDVNGAFSAIDSYAGTNDAAVAGAVSDASSAIAQAASAVSTANAANTTAGNASTAATNAVGTANNAMSLVNQTNTKIGTLANLTTTDKTSIVNAINEVDGKDAGDIAYDNSGSGLTATNVQDAIDEVAQGGGSAVIKTITADGVKTYSQILDEFHSELNNIKAGSVFSKIEGGTERFAQLQSISATNAEFSGIWQRTGGYSGIDFIINSSSSVYYSTNNGTTSDSSTGVPLSGSVFTLYA